jgi:hypothetical protein
MPTLNDFGDAGVARVQAILDKHAADSNTPKEAWYAYFNETGHLPQTLGEFVTFLNKVTKYGVARRDQGTGAITPIMPGVNPDPRLTPQDRGGFSHNITNAEDSQVQRFQQVDPSGNIFGGSWDPAYNAAHPELAGQDTMGGASTQAGMARSASVSPNNPYAGTPYEGAWEQANPSGTPFGTGTPTPTSTGGPPAASSSFNDPAAGAANRVKTVDATAYGNQQTLQAQIDDAIRRYALARTQEEREQAFLDLQRYQTDLKKIQFDQSRYDAMAQALLSSAVQLQNSPRDWMKLNQYTSGGRDIFAQMRQAGPAFAGTTGPVEPGSVDDMLRRLGIGPAPATPATPASQQPGAANPHNPELPAIPVPGSAGVPGALQPGATSGSVPGATAATAIPPHDQRLRELDQAAGGQWSGNRADPAATATAWWQANPARRGTPMPAWS